MNFMLDDKTKTWIQERGGMLTIDPPMPAGGWGGGAAARVSPQQPPDDLLKNYVRYLVEGIDVYVQQGAVMTGPAVIIGLSGIWRFKWLSVVGVGAVSACTI